MLTPHPIKSLSGREGILPNTQPVTQESQERNVSSYKIVFLPRSLSKQESHGGLTVFPQATQERSFGNVTCGTFVPACRVRAPGTVHTHPTGRNYPPHPVIMHPGHPGKPLISHLWVLQPQAHPTSPAAMESLEWVITIPVHTTQPPPHRHPALPGRGTQL